MTASAASRASSPVPRWIQWGAWGVVLGGAAWSEGLRWLDEEARERALTGWIGGVQADWLPFLPWLLLAPLLWWGIRGRRRVETPDRGTWWTRRAGEPRDPGAWLAAILIFSAAFALSWWIGTRFQSMPPAYHDEYSYLFQAQTYLAGRLWFPSFAPLPELFDQMHVLNEGRFASRYFPGAGLWMAPFVAWGNPWLGHQLAQALAAMLVFWTGRELSNNGVGLLAGLLFAVSPGPVLFSNLLLAHHPTLVGLMLFLWAFVRWLRISGGDGDRARGVGREETIRGPGNACLMALPAGIGLAFAMLCRPMTAAGFGLPFGLLFLGWWAKGFLGADGKRDAKGRTATALCLAAPLLVGILVVLYSNRQITGSPTTSPYQLYTEIYTPRHVYGFNNVVRGERNLGPKVLENYDRWAENLTPELAVRNVGERLVNSWRWSLGIVPLLLAGAVVLFTPQLGDRRWWLVLLAILSLHLAHVPYWFEGIMGWHYVFETAPLWLLIAAEATRRLFATWRGAGRKEAEGGSEASSHPLSHPPGRPAMVGWWLSLLAVSVAVNLATLPPLWPGRVNRGVAEIAYPRLRYAEFHRRIEELRAGEPVIVFVLPDPADRHIDYVTNPPDLSGPVLVARVEDRAQLNEALPLFPDRRVLLYDAAARRFTAL